MKKKFTSYTTSLAARPRSRRLRELGVAAAVAVSGATAASGGLLIDDLFEKVENGTDANGNIKWAIRAKYGLFSNEFIATRGASDDSGAVGGGIDVTFLEDYLAGKSYATESWVSGQLGDYYTKGQSDNRFQPKGNYLTQHQSLDSCAAVGNWQGDLDVKSGIYRVTDIKGKDDLPHLDNGSSILHFKWDVNASQQLMMDYADERVYARFERGNVAGNWNKLAYISDIPTSMPWGSITGKPTTLAEYGITDAYTKAEADGRYVDLSSNQAVGGTKTFTATVAGNYGFRSDGAADRLPWFEWHIPGVNYTKAMMTSDGTVHFVSGADSVPTSYHAVKALSFIRQGGTSAQFLKADGSVDGNSYALSSALGSYVKKAGDTMTGELIIACAHPALTLRGDSSNNETSIRYEAPNGYSYSAGVGVFSTASDWSVGVYKGVASTGVRFRVTPTPGVLYADGNNLIWHSGNDGSGSGLDADLLDGYHASRFTVYNTATLGNDVDFNAIPYNRSTAITIQPIHTHNYTGQKNVPFGGYGQMLTFGGYDSLFPFRIAYRQDNHLYLQGGGYKTAESFTFENKTWETIAFLSDVYTKAESDAKYVSKADLAEMFTVVTEGGKSSIKAMMGLWSADWIATKGQSDSSGGTSGAGIDVTFLESYLKGDNADKAVYATQSWVGSAIDSKLTAYATQSWVNAQGFLKSHQSLANYVTLDTLQTITANKIFGGQILKAATNKSWWNARDYALIRLPHHHGYSAIASLKTADGSWEQGVHTGNKMHFTYIADANYNIGNNTVGGQVSLLPDGGIEASKFIKSGGTSSQVLMADGSVNTRADKISVGTLDWVDNATNNVQIPSVSFLAYWNGQHSPGASNLQYCDRGRFGTIVTMESSDYVRALYGRDVLSGDMNEMLSNSAFIGSIDASANTPNGSGWYNVIQLPHRNGADDGPSFVGQIALGMTVNHEQMYFRTHRTGMWQHVLTESNYSAILNNLYYTEAEVNSLVGAKVAKAGDTMTGNLFMSNGSAVIGVTDGSGQDNQYGYVNVVRNAAADNLSCFSMVRSGRLAFGLGYTTANQIILGQALPGRTINPWLNINLDRSAANRFVSTVGTGTQPFACNSTTCNTNLNADLLDGRHSSGFSWRKYLGAQSDTHGAYVLLCPAYDGTLLDGGYFYGTVYINRGNSVSFNAKTAVMVQCSGQYNTNTYRYQVLSSSVNIQGLFIVRYNGTAYIALKMGGTSTMDFYVEGMWSGIDPRVINSDGAGVTEEAVLSMTPHIASNAASATKLQSARSIWGQSFDGTANVSGDMTGVGKITGSGSLSIIGNTAVEIMPGGDGSKSVSFTGTEVRPFVAAHSKISLGLDNCRWSNVYSVAGDFTGRVKTSDSFFLSRDGTLKIYTKDTTYGSETVCLQTSIDGTDGETHDYVNSQAYRCIMALQPRGGKVTVGNIAASDYALTATSFLCGSWVRTTGDTGWYNQTHGGGWYMTDSNWIRNHNNKSLYMTTATIRTDGRIEVGSNGDKFLVDSSGNVTSTASMKVVKSAAVKTVLIDGDVAVWGNSTLKVGWSNAFPTDVDIYFGKHTAFSGNVFFNGGSSKGLQLTSNDDYIGFFSQTNRDYQADLMRLRYDGTVEIPGNLRLEGSDAYGNRLSFGDSDYVYLEETEDDKLYIYADKGIYLGSDDGYINIAENAGLSFIGAGLLTADTAVKAIRCSCGFYSDKFIATKGTADLSDMRLKRVLSPMELRVEDIAAAPLFIHEWRNEPGSRALGSSAQYWEEYVPEAVHRLGDYRTMEYDKLAVAMGVSLSRRLLDVESRHSRWLEKHETRVQRLERRIKELEKELETLKQSA